MCFTDQDAKVSILAESVDTKQEATKITTTKEHACEAMVLQRQNEG